jgi:hypothetical protein
MNEEQLTLKIAELRATLTGDLFGDMQAQQKIYELKKELSALQGVTIEEYEANDDYICENCGS